MMTLFKPLPGFPAYKTVVKRNKVRVMSDLRQRTKSTLEGVLYVRHRHLFSGQNCQCSILTGKGKDI